MENVMNASDAVASRPRLLRTLGLSLGLAAATLINSGDRAFMASFDNMGIDPLQILDTGVKSNILFMVSQSDSMAGTTLGSFDIVGGDDPASRFYQVKRAIRDVISENTGKANFGLATFQPEMTEHRVEDSKGLIYVAQDPTADLFRNNFTAPPAVSGAMSVVLGAQTAGTTTNATTYSTSAYTPTANALLVVFTLSSPNGANPVEDPSSVTGHGLTYTKVASQVFNTDRTITAWVAKGNTTNGAVTATYATQRTMGWVAEYQVFGADLSGTALAAVAQRRTGSSAVAASSSSVTFASLATDPLDAVMYLTAIGDNVAITPKTGWTDGDGATSIAFGSDAANVQYKTTFDGTATSSFASNLWGGIALEFKIAPPVTIIDSCASGTCTSTESSGLFALMTSNDSATSAAYPSGCTSQSADLVASDGTVGTPVPHQFADVSTDASENSGINCRYYVRSKLMISGKRYTVVRGAAAGSAFTKSESITCPAPPAGLVGDDTLAANNGTSKRACFQLRDSVTSRIATYWLTGAQFVYTTVTTPDAGSPYQCNEIGISVDVSDCNSTASEAPIANLMRLELQYDSATGLPLDMPALTALNNRKPQSPSFTNVGMRLGTGAPLKKAMEWAKGYFNGTVFPNAAKRPDAAIGKQRQYVVLITDSNDTCGATLDEARAAAYDLWANANGASCDASCLASRGITAAQWAAANRVELVLVPFGGGTQSGLDAISQAGTGLNPATGTCESGAPCRPAPIARNLTELKNLLGDVIYSGSENGEYSDQQSVTETVFEFASLATPSKDPLDPNERYAVSVPILMQSTFILPGYQGHLKAFRRSNSGTVSDVTDDVSVEEWDAGQKLYDRVADTTTGMGTGTYAFETLYGTATTATVKTSNAKIKRRIYSTIGNGVNAGFTVVNLLGANAANLNPTGGSNPTRIAIWPPTPTSTTSLASVAPTATGTNVAPIKGRLDTAMGFDAWGSVSEVQAAVPGVCKSYVSGDLHPDCSDTTKNLARAKREAREVILAFIAGARLKMINGIPVRCTATNGTNSCGSNALAGELSYVVRPWIMSESTLAAPGVVTPPLLAGPIAAAGAVGVEEYKAYRDGLRNASTGVPVNGIANGLGLRNPDRVDASFSQSVIDAAAEDVDLKPSMSVVYHSTNQGLHAFRAGPCPTPPAGSGISALTIPCSGETGGEELWAFVPYDVLSKLPALTRSQSRTNKQYLLASPVRFADIFVPGTGSFGGQAFTGVWRTILYFGRGAGGKYYTAIDVTTPGPFTKHSLTTSEPIVVWSRGNPDTTRGLACNVGTHNNTVTSNDCPLYSKMGETWSVPAVGFVTAASYTTSRTGSNGTNFALFVGSGFSDVGSEGRTFFVLDALNGDIIRSFDIANGTVPAQTPTLTNFLVASPVGYTEDNDGNSPAGYNFIGNPIATKTKAVYFGDIHSRLWRYDATTPATAPVAFYTADTGDVGNQPFTTAVSVLQNKQADDQPADLYVFAESGFDRRVAIDTDKPFKAYAFKDVSGTREDVFEYDFPASYRGSVQPASGFAGTAAPLTPIVFYAGIKFNPSCVSTFDSVLIALKAAVTTPGVPEAAFDLKATGDDAFLEMTGKRVNAIRVSGEGSLVVDQGLNAQEVPPPPGVAVPSVAIPGSSSIVRMGLTPGTQDYKDLVATTQPYRVGSSVCRTQ